jgi:hypothetical protein
MRGTNPAFRTVYFRFQDPREATGRSLRCYTEQVHGKRPGQQEQVIWESK